MHAIPKDRRALWRVVEKRGRDGLAWVYRAQSTTPPKDEIEFAEALTPPLPAEEKWVLVLSSFVGCPVKCAFCDAGLKPGRKLTADEILAQADILVLGRYPSRLVPVRKFKVQLARVGEPMLNSEALDALCGLPLRYDAPGLLPCVSTMAPCGSENLFEELLDLRSRVYAGREFQLQFSIHSTDEEFRHRLFGVPAWTLDEIARYGNRFHRPGTRKVTLNFALVEHSPLDPDVLSKIFSADHFAVKLTPLNPTQSGLRTGLRSAIDPNDPRPAEALAHQLRSLGFETIVSIGDPEENRFGSNCGQMLVSALTTSP